MTNNRTDAAAMIPVQRYCRLESMTGERSRDLRVISLVALGILLAVTSGAQAQGVLSADVIKQSLAGNTAEVINQSNSTFVFYAPDGAMRMLNQFLGSDQGVWRVTPEGDFCGKWTKLRDGREACAPLIDIGGGLYQWGNSKLRILLGNPKGL